jgi:hypothetical protein
MSICPVRAAIAPSGAIKSAGIVCGNGVRSDLASTIVHGEVSLPGFRRQLRRVRRLFLLARSIPRLPRLLLGLRLRLQLLARLTTRDSCGGCHVSSFQFYLSGACWSGEPSTTALKGRAEKRFEGITSARTQRGRFAEFGGRRSYRETSSKPSMGHLSKERLFRRISPALPVGKRSVSPIPEMPVAVRFARMFPLTMS